MRNLVLVGESLVDLGDDPVDAICCDGERVFIVTRALEVVELFLASSRVALRVSLVAAGLAVLGRDVAVAVEHLADSNSLCVCLRNGDIVSVSIATSEAECVGTVDSGALGMAWSPDGELVVFATGNATLFCLSRTWMPVAEVPIRGAAGEGAPLSFALSFEGDGARFVTNTQFADGTTHVAIWTREGAHVATCELQAQDSHSPAVVFRPTGFLVAASNTNAKDGSSHVTLYESNGLAHGGFALRRGAALATSMSWSPDGSLLALVCDAVVQVWRSSNYVWHLSWEGAGNAIVGWSQERVGRLVVRDAKRIRVLEFIRDTACSSASSHGPLDKAVAAVVDGSVVRVTALQRAVVPPPMCEAQVSLPAVPGHVAVCETRLAAVSVSGKLTLLLLDAETLRAAPESVHVQLPQSSAASWMQVVWASPNIVLALSSKGLLVAVESTSGKLLSEQQVARMGIVNRLYANTDSGAVLLVQDASVTRVFMSADRSKIAGLEAVAVLPEPCMFVGTVGDSLLLAQSARFKLYAVPLQEKGAAAVVVESECTSFVTHSHFVIVSTLKSQLRFAPLLPDSLPVVEAKWDRNVETGALLVACVPRGCRTIVQAPRGSLETVYPRPLVMLASQKLLLEGGRYGLALELLRKHKVDLSHIAASPVLNIEALVRDVRDPDRLCLFLTQVGEGPCTAEQVNRVCCGVRTAVGNEDDTFVNVVLTSWVQQKPPQIPQALAVVVALRQKHHSRQVVFSAKQPRGGKDPSERALDYLTFLVPTDTLFDEALGMYDFDLVTVVAKKGQKDPREYVPFLEGLRRQSEPRMRHAIDVKLQRWESALRNLAQEEGAVEECVQLMKDKRLYKFALAHVWTSADDARRLRCYAAYGEYLEGKGHQAEATVCYGRAKEHRREMQCAEQLGDWAWAVARALDLKMPLDEARQEVMAQLQSQHRWEELARLHAWMPQQSAVVAECLVRAGLYSEAFLWGHDSVRLLLVKMSTERSSQLRGNATRFKQLVGRLRALRDARRQFEALRGQDDAPPVENPSEYSQASVASSRASAASGASSLATLAQGRAAQKARTAKKGTAAGQPEARRLTGKPGSMHEEEWLHRELRGLVPDEAQLRATFAMLLALMRCDCDSEAQSLQSAMTSMIAECDAALPDMLSACLLHGRGGVTYHQHWVPPGHLHVSLPPEHASSPGVDQAVLAPRAAVTAAFRWQLVLLSDQ